MDVNRGHEPLRGVGRDSGAPPLERSAAHDAFFDADIRAWLRQGWLEKLDLVYSRDQAERRYVQHRLAESATELKDWLDRGACIYICGSLAGMAPGVHQALITSLGESAVDALSVQGRYRRDVY